MFCKKCGKELPDLTMYCTYCGAPQFAAPKPEVKLELADSSSSKVVINTCENQTNTISQIRALTGMSVPEIRKLLQELPAVLLSSLTVEDAETTASMLRENGVDAEAVHKEKKEPVPVSKPEEKPTPAPAPEPEPAPESQPEPDPQPGPVPEPEPQPEPAVEEACEEPAEPFVNEEEEPETEPEEKPEKEEKVPVLTLEPSLMTDDESFMKEMEEFLNKK